VLFPTAARSAALAAATAAVNRRFAASIWARTSGCANTAAWLQQANSANPASHPIDLAHTMTLLCPSRCLAEPLAIGRSPYDSRSLLHPNPADDARAS